MLRENGIGVERKRAEVITSEMEKQLWSKGIMGYDTPKSLLNAVSSITVKTSVYVVYKNIIPSDLARSNNTLIQTDIMFTMNLARKTVQEA